MIDRWVTKYVAIRYVRLYGGKICRVLARNTGREILYLRNSTATVIAGVES